VAGIVDGDTIELTGIGEVRLIGADTPEVYGGSECYGREASAFTRRTLERSQRVRYRLGVERRDRYGRARWRTCGSTTAACSTASWSNAATRSP
jgi:endonuclease YncB( thermonuclease family)